MTEIKDIATSMLDMTDSIVRSKIKNSVIIAMYDRLVLPFFKKAIRNTPDEEVRKNLQMAYEKLKPHFEKKQFKDQIDEANELSGFKLANHGILKKESEYF